MVKFPKKIMTVSELTEFLGYSRRTLYSIFRDSTNTFAWLTPDGGKYFVDTDGFARYLERRAKKPHIPTTRKRRQLAELTCAQLMAAMPTAVREEEGDLT